MIGKQSDPESQQELTSLENREVTEIILSTGKKYKLGYVLPCAQDKLDKITTDYEAWKRARKEQEESGDKTIDNSETRKYNAKCVAALSTRNYLKLWLRFPYEIHWRCLYYFGNWSGMDYLRVIAESKKKAQEPEYYWAMELLMGMTTIWTTMTKKEAEEYRRERELVEKAQSLKNSQD